MAVFDIVLYPDDPLTQKAEPLDGVGPEIDQLVQDLIETMDAYDGVGLAAPQVGIPQRVFIARDTTTDRIHCFINPEILERSGSAFGDEGCLSIPGVYASVPRATTIKVRALTETGEKVEFEAHDFFARVIQHEYDHLEGIVFFDRLDILTRQDKMQEWEEQRAALLAERQEKKK